MNSVCLVGRIASDLEFKEVGGASFLRFSLAVQRNYTNSEGERDTDFIPVVVWRRLAEVCAENLEKGRLIGVVGRVQTRSWEDDDEKKHKVVEIVAEEVRFLDRKRDREEERKEAKKK